jgi:hypothetical protein
MTLCVEVVEGEHRPLVEHVIVILFVEQGPIA